MSAKKGVKKKKVMKTSRSLQNMRARMKNSSKNSSRKQNKKSSKKLVQKKVSKKVGKKNSKSISRKDFETFQIGIQRLKELEQELNSLDTRGFNKEANAIRSKLKNVSEIPNIERALKNLKLKIKGKYKPRRASSKHKLIRKDIKELDEKIQKVSKSRDIKKLQEEIQKLGKKINYGAKSPIDSGVEILVDSNFNNFLSETKRALSNRLVEKEKNMDVVLRDDLRKRELNYKQKRINLIREFNEKKRILEKELHKRLDKRYAEKLKRSLQKEVAEKFNSALQEKFDSEKLRLSRKYFAELRKHSLDNLRKNKQKLHERAKEEVQSKMNNLEEQYKRKIKNLKKREQRKFNKIGKKLNVVEDMKTRLALKIEVEDKLRRKLEQNKQNLEKAKKQFLSKKDLNNKELKKIKEDFDSRLKKIEEVKRNFILIKRLENKKIEEKLYNKLKGLQKARQDFVLKKKEEREEMKDKLAEEFHKKLQEEISKKEKLLRDQLRQEYNLKLKKHIQEHEQDLKQKKIDLELEMQKKIKQFLK